VCVSTPLNDVTKSKLAEIGKIQYLVSPDAEHTLFLTEFKKEYPNAKVIGGERVEKKFEGKIKFDQVFKDDGAPPAKVGYEDEIDSIYFPSHRNKEIAFLHRQSKSLIEADLLFNLPAKEQYSKAPKSWLMGMSSYMSPFNNFHKRMIAGVTTDKEGMRTTAKTVADWDFDRIIPCHGEVIESDGKKAWMEVFRDYLN